MRDSPFVSLKQLNAALRQVQRELYQAGLWYENTRLARAEVYWMPVPPLRLPHAIGFFTHGISRFQKFCGLKEGHIYIPYWVLAHGFRKPRGSLRDVLRHEYAHALAHYYPELIVEHAGFAKIFDGNYYDGNACAGPAHHFVSAYAATAPKEDFAETFMCFLRHKGKIPASWAASPAIRRKWDWVETCCQFIQRLAD